MASTFEYLKPPPSGSPPGTLGTWESTYSLTGVPDPKIEYIRFTLIDSLYEPQTLSIALRNSLGNKLNVLEGVLKRFQKVRLIEGETGNVIFYGKINRIGSELDASYGQLLNVSALDNLQELASKTISSDAEYGAATERSTIIRDIISGGTEDKHFKTHIQDLDNIITPSGPIPASNKFKKSPNNTDDEGTLNKSLSGSRKKVLDLIESIALEDETTNDNFRGYDFYLDTNFDNPSSDMAEPKPTFNYFPRGSVPTTNNGLTLKFEGREGNSERPLFPNFGFPQHGEEIATRVRLECAPTLEDINGNKNVVPTTIELILINVTFVPGQTFTLGTQASNKITWGTEGEAYVRAQFGNSILISSVENPRDNFLGLQLPDSVADIADFFFKKDDNWLKDISTMDIMQNGDHVATANVNNDAQIPPGSIREAIESDREIVITDYESQSEEELMVRAARTLIHGADAVIRGDLVISRFPYTRLTGTIDFIGDTITDNNFDFMASYVHINDAIKIDDEIIPRHITNVSQHSITFDGSPFSVMGEHEYKVHVMTRTGHTISIENIPSANIEDQSAIVTKIEYTEAPGDWTSKIEVLLHVKGHGEAGKLSLLKSIRTQTEAASFQTPGQIGQPTPSLNSNNAQWLYEGVFTPVGTDRLEWTNPSHTGDPTDPDDLDGDGTLTLKDGREFTIRANHVESIPSDVATYLYYDTGTDTGMFESTTDIDVLTSNQLVVPIAWMKAGMNTLDYILFGLTFQEDTGFFFDESIVDWATDIQFSITDSMGDPLGTPLDSVSWTSGTIKFAGGGTAGTVLGSGPNPSDPAPITIGVGDPRVWIYFDKNRGTNGEIRHTTTIQSAVGLGRITLATAARNPAGGDPSQPLINLYVYNSSEGVILDGGLLIANTIAGNKIVANSIIGTHISTSTISADKFISNIYLGDDHRIVTGGVPEEEEDPITMISEPILDMDGNIASYIGRRLVMDRGGLIGYNVEKNNPNDPNEITREFLEFAIINGTVSYPTRNSSYVDLTHAIILLGENNEVAVNKGGMYLRNPHNLDAPVIAGDPVIPNIFPGITFYSSSSPIPPPDTPVSPDTASINATGNRQMLLRVKGGLKGLLLETQNETASNRDDSNNSLNITLSPGMYEAGHYGNIILNNLYTVATSDITDDHRILIVNTPDGGTVGTISIADLGITATGTHTHEWSLDQDNMYQSTIDVNYLDFRLALTYGNVSPTDRRILGIESETAAEGNTRRVLFFTPSQLFTSSDDVTMANITATSIDLSSHITVPVGSINGTDTPSYLLGILGTRDDDQGDPVYMGRVYSFELSGLLSGSTGHTHEWSLDQDSTYQRTIDVNSLVFRVALTFGNVPPPDRRILGIDSETAAEGNTRIVRFFTPAQLFTSSDAVTMGNITASSIDISSHITVPVTSINATDAPVYLLGTLGTMDDDQGDPVYNGRVYSFELSNLILSITHSHEWSLTKIVHTKELLTLIL